MAKTLLEKRQEKATNALLSRRSIALRYIRAQEKKHAEKIAPYNAELETVHAALTASGYNVGEYPDEICESGCDAPVTEHDGEGVPLCQACADDLRDEARAETEGMIAGAARHAQ